MSNVNWRDYTIPFSSEGKEKSGWSIAYSFGKDTPELPRLMLIGDSICNAYQRVVKEKLEGKANLTYWVSSKCVTDLLYLPELDQKLDMYEYDVICFNNGLHSLYSDKSQYDEAYEKCVDFIMAKCPSSKLFLTLSTPLKDARLTEISASLNETVRRVAEARKLPVIDLFSLMDPLNREQHWSDVYHYKAEAVALQADKLIESVEAALSDARK